MDNVFFEDALIRLEAPDTGLPESGAPGSQLADEDRKAAAVKAHAEAAESPRSLAKCVHRAILRLAPGKIRELRVEVRQGTISLFGNCSSFYCKQIAQHAAMDLAHGEQVNNQILVDG